MNDTKAFEYISAAENFFKALFRDDNLNMGLLKIERGNYFRITDVNRMMSKALNIAFDENGNATNGGDDFLMYIPWDQRRDMFDYLDKLEVGASVEVEHSLVGKEKFLQTCYGKFFAFPTDNGKKEFIGLYRTDERFEISLEQMNDKSRLSKHVYIQTFGYFDVFIDGVPAVFKNAKAKELLALLADRKGDILSQEDAVAYLWDNEEVNKTTLARYRKAVSRLESELRDMGIQDILRKDRGSRRIDTSMVKCDLFDYLSGEESLYNGSYMKGYSWGDERMAKINERP